MKRTGIPFRDSMRKYRFEIWHLSILFIVLIIFQIVVSFVHKISLQKFLVKTQVWYQQESAERLANLTTTSLELLLEAKSQNQKLPKEEIRKIVQDFNIIFSQQKLHQNVQEVCLLVAYDTSIVAIDDGKVLYSYTFEHQKDLPLPEISHAEAITLYRKLNNEISGSEQIKTVLEGKQTFHIFVPFVPRGEYLGAVYMKNTPDFSLITREIISSYNETAVTYSALILVGLLAMFYISSFTLRARNEAQQQLFEEQKKHLTEQINVQNELLFTKRIYHTHHKAEKVMGFIREDIHNLSRQNIIRVKNRIDKYASFIARVIYDMKWFDPPIQTIRSPLFHTNLNDVIRFLVKNIFQRVSNNAGVFDFVLDLDENIPPVPINEYVVWEILEPLVQNALDHADVEQVTVTVSTRLEADHGRMVVSIRDNGRGIAPWLLEKDVDGVKKIFLENTTTKRVGNDQHSGYGCYIAREIALQRCGWDLDADNVPEGGSRVLVIIPLEEQGGIVS
jgi:signal transduction histidine kinase